MSAEIHFDSAALAELLGGPTGLVVGDLRRRGNRVLSGAKQRCNVDTGRLRSSLHLKVGRDGRGVFVDVGSDVEYAEAVHEGSRPHPIFPRQAKVLAFSAGGSTVFARSVSHPGYRGNPFLTDALRAEF